MTNWMNKWHNRQEFLSYFECEQDYVDAMFTQIVMFNFGEYIDATMMLTADDEDHVRDDRAVGT